MYTSIKSKIKPEVKVFMSELLCVLFLHPATYRSPREDFEEHYLLIATM